MKSLKKAFTILELALVIVIIVLLIAIMAKVNSLIKSTKIKVFYTRCIEKWITKYNDFYSRAGAPLGFPLYTYKDGKVNVISNVPGVDIPYSSKNLNFDFVLRKPSYIISQMQAFGISINETDSICYAPSEKGEQAVIISSGADILVPGETISVCLDSNCSSSNIYTLKGVSDKNGVFLVFINLPYDVAIAIDREIDGISNGKKGTFVCLGAYKKPIDINTAKVDEVIKIKGLGNYSSFNCGGSLSWGNESNAYVTAAYIIK